MLLRIFTTIFIAVSILVFSIAAASNLSDKPMRLKYVKLSPEAEKQIDCLAENIYFESAREPTEGQIAVAFVTMNRVYSRHFPNTICEVVKQRNARTCQFSWWCETKPYHISTNNLLTKTNNTLYNDIRELAIYFYVNHEKLEDPSDGALFYHADYVNPRWPNMIHTATIGRHIFYQKKGLNNDTEV